jgi:G3E family GTPase
VSNELGELGIDRSLLGDGGEAYVELEGGCVCCELSDDLIVSLQNLWEQVHPDRVIIETSGVALPFDTQLNFWRHPVRDWIGEDMAVVVVNAEQVAEGRDLQGTFEDQVSSADLLVLNKVDLVSVDSLPRIESLLKEIEPSAPIVHCSHGQLDVRLLFPPGPADFDRAGPAPESPPHGHEAFTTEIWRAPADLSCAELTEELSQRELLRAKGFVQTREGLHLIQVVGRRIELSPLDRAPAGAQVGDVVLIRRGTDPS